MSFWDSYKGLYDPGRAYRSAGKEIKKGYQEGQGYLQPYNQAGMDELQKLLGAQGNLLDPSKLQSEWAKGYEISPYAKQLQDQAKASGMDAASSQGLLGSSTALNSIQQGSSNIMQADRDKYMNDLMQKYMAGIGIGQDIYGKGAGAAGQMSNNAMDFGKQMGSMKFGESNALMDQFMNMFKMYAASQGGGM